MPDRPNWAPLLIIRKRNIVTTKVLVELPLDLGVSREDSAISKPARSRLFKLIGRMWL